ncbi:MAG: hypothetical protein HKN87_13960 [Saprospiraceae bacterium]|nr:hypothetical protein [Saprospiraceae bacterium]
MRTIPIEAFLIFALIGVGSLVTLTAQSGGVVLSGGLVWADVLDDQQGILNRSQAGYTAGIEMRLGADDHLYFKVGTSFSRLHFLSQDHPESTQFFAVQDGYDVLKAMAGLETRLISTNRINWRLSGGLTFNYVSNVLGNVRFAYMNTAFFGLRGSTGIDLSFITLDLGLEPGLSDFLEDRSDAKKPFIMTLTAGVHF